MIFMLCDLQDLCDLSEWNLCDLHDLLLLTGIGFLQYSAGVYLRGIFMRVICTFLPGGICTMK